MRRLVCGAWLGCLLAGPSSAQSPVADGDVMSSFVGQARSGTAHYRDRSAAIADGFRRIGVDFPAMGEHWVSLQRVLDDTFDIARPSMLTYITIDGAPVLAGVGYAVLLDPGELPPDFAPANGFWHEHNGSITDESLPHHHSPASPGDAPGGEAGRRFSLLHAWVWTENPAGVFVTDNWTLPARRLGILPDDRLSPAVQHAITLGLGGAPYYALVLRSAVSPSESEEAIIEGVLEARRVRVAGMLALVQSSGVLEPGVARELEAQWSELWDELRRELPRVGGRVDEARRELDGATGGGGAP